MNEVVLHRLSGYRAFVSTSLSILLEQDEETAHRIQDEYSEVLRCINNHETFRRESGHSLGEMLKWLEQDLTAALAALDER